MKDFRLYIIFILCIIITGCLPVRLRTANENYQQFAYAEAIKDYEWVLQKKSVPEAIPLLADAYRQVGNAPKAEYWYKQAVKQYNSLPVWKLYLAEALMKQGKCEEAKPFFREYIELNRSDYRAQRLLASCDSMDIFYTDTTLYNIQLLKFNAQGENNFSPAFYRSGIVFSSDRPYKGLSVSKSDWTGKRYLDLFYAQRTEKGNWVDPEPLRGEINGRFNEGPAVFTKDYSTAYFTRNNYMSSKVEKNKKSVNVLKIFKASNDGGIWKINGPVSFASDDYSVCHPTLNHDGTVMYFASDIPWGYGGMDIYMVRKEGAEAWSKPVNLGPKVNTEGNEVFPFLQNDSTLFYSSDGRLGVGGLDVFVARYYNNEWQDSENLNVPLNSSFDDFGYIIDSAGTSGYFTSNRFGGVDKIFSFTRNQPQLAASITLSAADKGSASSPTQFIIYKDDKQDTVVTVAGLGKLVFKLEFNHKYDFLIDNREFYSQKVTVSTIGRKISETIPVSVSLERIKLDTPVKWDGITFQKKKWQLTTESGEALDSLATLLENNPRLQIEIGSYTDSRNSDADNISLTQKRAEMVETFLASRGIKKDRLVAKGYGEAKLLNNCVNNILCIEEDHQVNNRIEITVLSILKNTGMQ